MKNGLLSYSIINAVSQIFGKYTKHLTRSIKNLNIYSKNGLYCVVCVWRNIEDFLGGLKSAMFEFNFQSLAESCCNLEIIDL